jgi:hypothetical protein
LAAATAAAVARLFSTARTSLKLLHHVMAVDELKTIDRSRPLSSLSSFRSKGVRDEE